jgi:hypothetical protein
MTKGWKQNRQAVSDMHLQRAQQQITLPNNRQGRRIAARLNAAESVTGVGTDKPRDTSATHCAVSLIAATIAKAEGKA